MNIAGFLGVFGLIFVLELPDKTMMATIVMSTKARPRSVAIGASFGYVLQMGIAVGVGGLLTLFPHRWKELIVALLFLGGAAYLLFVPEKNEIEVGEKRAQKYYATKAWREILTAFTVIFVSEFGDLTQIQAANFVAKTHEPLEVFVGASLALISLAFIGAYGGSYLLRHIPLAKIRLAGGLIFTGLGIYTLVQVFSS